jgi:hypothetical protein
MKKILFSTFLGFLLFSKSATACQCFDFDLSYVISFDKIIEFEFKKPLEVHNFIANKTSDNKIYLPISLISVHKGSFSSKYIVSNLNSNCGIHELMDGRFYAYFSAVPHVGFCNVHAVNSRGGRAINNYFSSLGK